MENSKERKKEIIKWLVNNIMNNDTIKQLNAEKYKGNNQRTGYGYGYYMRKLVLHPKVILERFNVYFELRSDLEIPENL